MKATLILAAGSLLLGLAASPAMAGQPNNPGAGGEGVRVSVEIIRDREINPQPFGQAISERVLNDAVYGDWRPGERVQDTKGFHGGDPNPNNDIGGGNND